MLSSCVGEAYRSYLAVNHFPWAVLNLSVPYDIVDVNVHPAKSQVRFKDERHIYQAVLKWVRETLEADNIFKTLNSDVSKPFNSSSNHLQDYSAFHNSPFYTNYKLAENKVDVKILEQNSNLFTPHAEISLESFVSRDMVRLIGSAFNTYIIAQGESEIYLIDQHAAHERMLYEKYKDDLAFKKITMQFLLSPLIIDIAAADQIFLTELIETMNKVGFDIEMFDRHSLAIRGIPSLLSSIDIKAFVHDLSEIMCLNPYADHDFRLEQIIKQSCKKAVKANNPLTNTEMLYLIDAIIKKRIPSTCPHGRPIIVPITQNELEVMFKRK